MLLRGNHLLDGMTFSWPQGINQGQFSIDICFVILQRIINYICYDILTAQIGVTKFLCVR